MKVGLMATRLEKRELIVATAEKIFLRQGLFETAMDQIAEDANLSRRTLYRYFDKKEDLAYEVTTRLITQWNDFFGACYQGLNGNGLAQLEQFLQGLIGYMSEKIDVMKYLGEFDFYFKDAAIFRPSEDQERHFNDVILVSDDYLKNLLKKGIQDGSIDPSICIEITEATISNVMWTFGQRVASRRDIIHAETGFQALELIEYQVALYIKALAS